MESAYIGSIMPWAMDYEPVNWMMCKGQILPIAQYQALFAIINSRFGGDGRTNFALPNLQKRILIGTDSNIQLGAVGGLETATLTADHLPAHNHTLIAAQSNGINTPTGAYLAQTSLTDKDYLNTGTLTQLAPNALSSVGNAQPVSVVQPYIALNFIICVNGSFPPRP